MPPEGILTGKRLAFVEHYIQSGGKRRESVRAAGYSAASDAMLDKRGKELLADPKIIAALKVAQGEIKAASRVGTEEKRMRLWELSGIHMHDNPEAAIKAIHEMNVMDGDLKGNSAAPAFSIEQAIMMVTGS